MPDNLIYCHQCGRSSPWTDGTDTEFWCPVCGLETTVVQPRGHGSQEGQGAMKRNIDPDWLLRMAEKEGDGDLAVGGLAVDLGLYTQGQSEGEQP